MNYELAKKLKDAGFPQIPQNDCFIDGDDSVTKPTLSELIEACGDLFVSLHPNKTIFWNQATKKNEFSIVDWRASGDSCEGNITPMHVSVGQTPEEAVANLWLELNKE